MIQLEIAKQIRKLIKETVKEVSDATAAGLPLLFDPWEPGQSYAEGDRREYSGRLYKCRQDHTSEEQYTPDMIPALWEALDVEHAGTKDDPIPAAINMQYFEGKYYSEDSTLYRCTRDSGIPMSYLPSQLIGQYFEIAQEEL